MATTCPGCGEPASGKFCSHCGATLQVPTECSGCGNQLPSGARFCNMCGTPAGAASASPAPANLRRRLPLYLPWTIAGVAVGSLAAVLFLVGRGADAPAESSSPTAVPPMAGSPAPPDISSLTPREAADRLFNRVMTSVSAGDSAEALTFAPMAIAAYERAEPLDIDGRYHLATLHIVNSNFEAAGVEADAILAEVPTHLYGLFTGAQVAAARGDEAASLDLFQQFLDNYDAEFALARSEYLDHQAILPAMRQEAIDAVQGDSAGG